MIQHFLDQVEECFTDLKEKWDFEQVTLLPANTRDALAINLDKGIKTLTNLVAEEKRPERIKCLDEKYKKFCILYQGFKDMDNSLTAEDVISDYMLDSLIYLAEICCTIVELLDK